MKTIYAVEFNGKLSQEAYATFEEAKNFLEGRVENGCEHEWLHDNHNWVRYTNTSGQMIEAKIIDLTFKEKN